MSLQKITLNGHSAIQDNATGKVAILPDGHRLLETEFGVVGATDLHGQEIDLQFYERTEGDVISREVFFDL